MKLRRPKSAPVAITLVGDRKSRWRVEATNLPRLRHTVGDDVFATFARCFVHADRLTSLAQFGRWNGRDDVNEVSGKRNVLTCLWFSVGTLRELAKALRNLRAVLAKRGLLDADVTSLHQLREVESRWEDDAFFRKARDFGAFHVDAEVIRRGVERFSRKSSSVPLVEGHGVDVSSSIGADALVAGMGLSSADLRRFLDATYHDVRIYEALDRVFLGVLRLRGIHLRERPWRHERSLWDVPEALV